MQLSNCGHFLIGTLERSKFWKKYRKTWARYVLLFFFIYYRNNVEVKISQEWYQKWLVVTEIRKILCTILSGNIIYVGRVFICIKTLLETLNSWNIWWTNECVYNEGTSARDLYFVCTYVHTLHLSKLRVWN